MRCHGYGRVGRFFVGVVLAALFAGCGSEPVGVDLSTRKWELQHASLGAVPDNDLEWRIVEKVSNWMGDDYSLDLIMQLPEGPRVVYATWELEGQVSNGGFEQYFLNTGGALAEVALNGYRLFGAHQSAALVEEAVANRQDLPKLSQLDDRLYAQSDRRKWC